MSIRILDQQTIDQIAAGEVVERPASIVKELVENALDAQADRIAVEIRDGGISLIQVSDNGCGIPGEEMELAFSRHATSKIVVADDLDDLKTLGFRGEALSSIAAVSRTECITRTPSSISAYRLLIEGGTVKDRSEVGAPCGTSVFVRDLFYNTPARGKFLKTAMTEAAHISAVLEQMALSHPGISFRFTANGKEKLLTSGNGSVADVIYAVFGKEVYQMLLQVEEIHRDDVTVYGYIAKPQISRGNRNYENYYLNGRMIKSPLIDRAIEEGYGTCLMQHRYPFSCLYLQIPGELVDVNVHPTKMEVRFLNEKAVFEAVSLAVSKTLSEADMIIRETSEDLAIQTPKAAEKEERFLAAAPFETVPFEAVTRRDKLPQQKEEKPVQQSLFERLPQDEQTPLRRLIGHVFSTYLLVEFGDTLYLIDQHAAHEKILYEKLMRACREAKVSLQELSPPLILSLDAREHLLVEQYQEAFERIGFTLESFGGKEIKISTVPYQLGSFSSKDLFLDLLATLGEDRSGQTDLQLCIDRIASAACKAAVKGGSTLSSAEAQHLLDELFKLVDPYHCPHGRPTVISFTKTDLERRFKRIL